MPTRSAPTSSITFQPLSLDRFGEPLHKFPAFTASVANLQPTSRGTCGCARATRRRAGDQAQLSVDRRRPPHRRSTPSALTRRIVAQPALAPFHPAEYLPGRPAVRDDDEQALVEGRGRHRHHHLSSRRHRENGSRERSADGGRRAPARRRRRAAARHRCFGHADDHLRQHQRPDHDDRGKGRRHDPRRRQRAAAS
jgi:hypothetical protein